MNYDYLTYILILGLISFLLLIIWMILDYFNKLKKLRGIIEHIIDSGVVPNSHIFEQFIGTFELFKKKRNKLNKYLLLNC